MIQREPVIVIATAVLAILQFVPAAIKALPIDPEMAGGITAIVNGLAIVVGIFLTRSRVSPGVKEAMRGLALVPLLVLNLACASAWQRDALRVPSHQAMYVPPTSATMAARLEELRARVLAWGVEIVVPAAGDGQFWGMAGATGEGQRRIILSPELGVDGTFEVLAHEAAHLLQPGGLTEAQREVFAERVMVAVCDYYGYEASKRSSQYLARYKTGFAQQAAIEVDYRRAVRVLTGQEQP